VEILFFLVFTMIFCIFLTTFVKGISQWHKNNQAPRLTVEALIVAKRTNVSRHRHGGVAHHAGHTTTSTTYYVTFQVASGDRFELQMSGAEYGLLVEGDRGDLSFQGTRFLGFARK